MKVGDLVKVKTKHYGFKLCFLVEKVVDSRGESWMVCPTDHPRNIMAELVDMEVVSENTY